MLFGIILYEKSKVKHISGVWLEIIGNYIGQVTLICVYVSGFPKMCIVHTSKFSNFETQKSIRNQ